MSAWCQKRKRKRPPTEAASIRHWNAELLERPRAKRRRIAYETATGEPELAILDRLMRRGGTAVDVGVNQGFFAFALARLSRRVICFEPNSDYASFARWMLRGRAEVHALALADRPGRASFYVPHSDDGMALHLAGSLKRACCDRSLRTTSTAATPGRRQSIPRSVEEPGRLQFTDDVPLVERSAAVTGKPSTPALPVHSCAIDVIGHDSGAQHK